MADAHALAEEGFRLELGGGDGVQARRLLLATGLADELPAIDGLAALWGRSAFHCPYCHGFEVSGQRLAVLGAGPERLRLALQLTRFTDDLVLCTNGEPLPRDLGELLAANGVRVRGEPVTRFEGDGGRLEWIILERGERLDRDAVFIPTVLHQRSDLAGRLGCALLADGCVEVDEFARTSVPGVYAAGDMAHRSTLPMPFAAVSWASASGTLAGRHARPGPDRHRLPAPGAPTIAELAGGSWRPGRCGAHHHRCHERLARASCRGGAWRRRRNQLNPRRCPRSRSRDARR